MEQVTAPYILALDISKSTGWAIGSPDMNHPRSGVFKTYLWKGHEEDQTFQFWQWLHDRHAEYRLAEVIYEQSIIKPKAMDLDFIEIQKAYITCVWLFCKINGVKCSTCHAQSWRARFLGLTKEEKLSLREMEERERYMARKGLAIKACHERGWIVEDDNEAEACGILDFILCERSQRYRTRTGPLFRRAEHVADRESLVR